MPKSSRTSNWSTDASVALTVTAALSSPPAYNVNVSPASTTPSALLSARPRNTTCNAVCAETAQTLPQGERGELEKAVTEFCEQDWEARHPVD
jgi:hypothetical protein